MPLRDPDRQLVATAKVALDVSRLQADLSRVIAARTRAESRRLPMMETTMRMRTWRSSGGKDASALLIIVGVGLVVFGLSSYQGPSQYQIGSRVGIRGAHFAAEGRVALVVGAMLVATGVLTRRRGQE